MSNVLTGRRPVADDRKQRDTIEARNRADAMVYNIEKTLREHRDKIGDADAQAIDAAIAIGKKGATLDAKTLLDHMRPRVASWWMPDAVEFLDEFPMTGTGKVLKSALRDKFKGYRAG